MFMWCAECPRCWRVCIVGGCSRWKIKIGLHIGKELLLDSLAVTWTR